MTLMITYASAKTSAKNITYDNIHVGVQVEKGLLGELHSHLRDELALCLNKELVQKVDVLKVLHPNTN